MSNLNIRPMQVADARAVASVHKRSFQGFFLSSLGEEFLRELYAGIVVDPTGIGFVYETETGIGGFVAGTDEPEGVYRRLFLERWLRFALAAVKPVAQRPSIVFRLMRALRGSNDYKYGKKEGLLMSIAVHPDMQGQGIGRALVEAFLRESSHRKLERVSLTTDKVDNKSVNAFYQKMGWKCLRTFVTSEGREMNFYQIEL